MWIGKEKSWAMKKYGNTLENLENIQKPQKYTEKSQWKYRKEWKNWICG